MQPERQGSDLISVGSQHLKYKREQVRTWVEFQNWQVFHLYPFLDCLSPFCHLYMGMCPWFRGTGPVSLPASPAPLSSTQHGPSPKAPPRSLTFLLRTSCSLWLPCLSYPISFALQTPLLFFFFLRLSSNVHFLQSLLNLLRLTGAMPSAGLVSICILFISSL